MILNGGEMSHRLKLKIVTPHTKAVERIVDMISINSVKSKEYKNQLLAKAKNDQIKKGVAGIIPLIGFIRVAAKAKIRFISATVK
jgi:hypothetical protein